MRNIGSALLGALTLVVLIVIGAAVYAAGGFYNVGADQPHGAVAKAIAYVRERSIESRAENIKPPPLNNPAMAREGAEHYSAMCTGCHLAPGMKDSEMRPGLNPKPPALASLPPGGPAEQFWIIKHGIRMTAMPAWGTTHSDEEIWNIVAFLQKLPGLSPQQYRALTQNAHEHMEHME